MKLFKTMKTCFSDVKVDHESILCFICDTTVVIKIVKRVEKLSLREMNYIWVKKKINGVDFRDNGP